MLTAVHAAHQLGINPGGSVRGIPIPDQHLPATELRERLLTYEELVAAGLINVDIEQARGAP